MRIDPRTLGRIRAIVDFVRNAVAIAIGGNAAAVGIHRCVRRRVRTVVDFIRDAIGVTVDDEGRRSCRPGCG